MIVPINEIIVGKRLRNLREASVAELAESIDKLGLRVPISVAVGIVRHKNDADGISFELVAGHHRLEACRRLGWSEIEATIVQMDQHDERELWEIDENLCRADLTELERGEHLLRRKEIYERKWPQTARGANVGPERQFVATDQPSFAEDTAGKTDLDKRSIQRSIRRVKKIDERTRDRVRALPEIADSGVELDALAKMEPQQQRKAVALVENGQASGIRDARRLMKAKAKVRPAPAQQADGAGRQCRREAFARAWAALDEVDREWARINVISEKGAQA
jgi:ParB family chromosome partitioning protein